ncbi:hypothetical protein J2Y69_002600 [Microbacterium resistens]|uniref:DUF3137 domain-containing protein n=1 Tax=Microbacterium resistens TaxID=156977 RepID=A0ABU1SEK5_9MICO|nr:hypothetical protein [Microbacterium resistens]MDR6867992.1 hypothetical protein [Microbacterium resistens]
MTDTGRPSGIDARPLTAPVDPAAFSAYTRAAKANGESRTPASQIFVWAIMGFVALMMLFLAVLVLFVVLQNALSTAWLVPLLPLIPVAAIAGIVVASVVLRRRSRIRRYRLNGFTAANAMSYVPLVTDPALPGMVFGLGHTRRAEDLVRGAQPRFVEFGNFQYTTGSGKNSETHRWGYVAIKLDVPLPNIVLDAAANDGIFGSSLPARFSKDQRLSLEGDFDRHFSLFCPAGYERDALYLFTPDIMARFMDHAAQFDAEIVDDWLFLYARNEQVSTLDPARWSALFTTVGAVLTKLDQWARWRDERLRADASAVASAFPAHSPWADGAGSTASARPLEGAAASAVPFAAPPAPGVAAPGRRLRRTGSWIGVVAVVGIGALWFFSRIVFGH